MRLVTDARDKARTLRVIGIILVIAAPGLAFGSWYSTRQPLEMLAWSEANRARIPAEAYGSAVYMAAHAQRTLDEKWTLTGFATLGITGLLVGVGCLWLAQRSNRQGAVATAG
jgi:hypothetical protein